MAKLTKSQTYLLAVNLLSIFGFIVVYVLKFAQVNNAIGMVAGSVYNPESVFSQQVDASHIALSGFVLGLVAIGVLSALFLVFSLVAEFVGGMFERAAENSEKNLSQFEVEGVERNLVNEVTAWLKSLYRQQRTVGAVSVVAALVSVLVAYSLFQTSIPEKAFFQSNYGESRPILSTKPVPLRSDSLDPPELTIVDSSNSVRTEHSDAPAWGAFLYNALGKALALFSALVLFGYSFAQYRRVDRRITELRSLLVAKSMEREKITPDDFVKLRETVGVHDELRGLPKRSVELGMLEGISDALGNLTETVKRQFTGGSNKAGDG